MKKFIKKHPDLLICTLIITAFLIFVIVSFLILQRKMFFKPTKDEESYSKLKENEEFEEVNINSNGQKLTGWMKYDSNKNEKKPLIIYFPGNTMNASTTCYAYYTKNIFEYFKGYNILIMDYPGYGHSEGTPSDKSFFKTALNTYDYATSLECVDTNNIIIMGYSIGTGVATYLCSERNVNGLILVAPYDNALSLYNDNLNIFHGILKHVTRYKFTSDVYAKKVKVSPLIITSYDDEIINYRHSIDLSNCFAEIEDFIILDEGIKHSHYFLNTKVLNSIEEYLKNRI